MKTSDRFLEYSTNNGIYLNTARLLTYLDLVPIAWLLREVVENVPRRSSFISVGDVMDAVVAAPNRRRLLQEALVITDGFPRRLQESNDAVQDDGVAQHRPLVLITSERVEVLDEVLPGGPCSSTAHPVLTSRLMTPFSSFRMFFGSRSLFRLRSMVPLDIPSSVRRPSSGPFLASQFFLSWVLLSVIRLHLPFTTGCLTWTSSKRRQPRSSSS